MTDTIRDKVEANADRGARATECVYRDALNHDDTTAVMGDLLIDLMHALDERYRDDPQTPDAILGVLADVERAVGHYLCEARAFRTDPGDSADALGGYHNPFVNLEIGGLI